MLFPFIALSPLIFLHLYKKKSGMRSKVSRFSLIPFVIFTLIVVGSCKKKAQIDSNPAFKLTFSTDTVFFDTVFTTLGTVTQRLIVHNNNTNKIQVSSIKLAGGSNSVFSLNIDGNPGSTASNVDIAGHDSLYIFVKVTLNPNNQNNPLIIADSILFNTNGNQQKVELVAWGQDAYFYKNMLLKGTNSWDSIKPRVIYGYLRVDTGASLYISAGTKLYFHKSAYMAVSNQSTLDIEGSYEHQVRFMGDRLDPFYRDLPGQWDGIYLEKGSNSTINYAFIKNGNFGVSVDSAIHIDQPMLTINNTIIQNMVYDDIYAYATNISSVNCVLEDCGGSSLALDFGGNYTFKQLTIGNYWSNSVRLNSALYLSNYTSDTSGHITYNNLVNADFGNMIVYGTQDDEINFDAKGSALFNYTFDHCLLKTKKNTSNGSIFMNCIINKDPGFVDVYKYNYEIDSISPAIGNGSSLLGVQLDIKGNPRSPYFDIGAYQYEPK